MVKLNITLVSLTFLHLIKQLTMNIKKLAIGGIVAGILFFLLGWLIYGILLMDFMKANPGVVGGYDKAAPDMLWLVIGNLLSGFLMAYIFVKANVNTLANGFITAAVVGLLMSASYDCMSYGLTNLMSKKMMIADVLAAAVLSGIVGAVTGLVMGKIK
jgi:uncharacterized protein with PQ loop repeat